MKKIFNIILCILILFSFTACSGSFAQTDLNEPVAVPEDGIISKNTLNKLKNDNAIATFTGVSGELQYDWTIFGSDLENTKDINLSLDLSKNENGLRIVFHETEDFGFPALLSVHLDEKWTAGGATAYTDEKPVYSVSITGSRTSILNLSINSIVPECIIVPDDTAPVAVDDSSATETKGSGIADKTEDYDVKTDNYLSNTNDKTGYAHSDNKTKNEEVSEAENNEEQYDYLSSVKESKTRKYSDGSRTGKDEYLTDPVPVGKPLPVEPENQEIDSNKTYTCTFSIECSTILNNLGDLNPDKRELVPSDGVILPETTVTFYEGESVFDVLKRVCKQYDIHMEASWTPVYNSAYIEGINNLYEFDCGELSGWMYRVNGWYPNYGSSRYQLTDGEKVEWRYTCTDLGKDIGCNWMV